MSKLYYKHLQDFKSSEGYWSNTDCVKVAEDIISITNAKSLLEIGFNIGYSAATWLESGIESLVIIDINNHSDTVKAIEATAEHYSNKDIKWWLGNSQSKNAYELEMPDIDISFIDGEHTMAAAYSDSNLSIHYGAKWLVFDDVIDNHVNGIDRAIDKLISENKIELIKKYTMTWTELGEVVLCKVIK